MKHEPYAGDLSTHLKREHDASDGTLDLITGSLHSPIKRQRARLAAWHERLHVAIEMDYDAAFYPDAEGSE